MRTLEWNIGQEIQTLQKAVVKIFENIEETIKTDEQGKKGTRTGFSLISMCQSLS